MPIEAIRHRRIRSLATLLCSLAVAQAWVIGVAPRAGSRDGGSACRSTAPNVPFTVFGRRHRDWATTNCRTNQRRPSRGRTRVLASENNWAWGKAKSIGDTRTPAAQALASGQELKLGVLLLNLGGPERQEDVQPFLYNLFADPDIIRLPKLVKWLQAPIAAVLSARRAPQSKSAYERIGGGSPIVSWTNAQAAAIAAKLEDKGLSGAKCYVGMRYWHPFTEAALEAIEQDDINALVVLPLYPQFSISTSGSSLRVLNEEFTRRPEKWGHKKVVHTVVPSYHDRPGYINAMAALVAKEVAQFSPEERREGVQVLFSAHGVPKSYIDAGDPYQQQIETCVRLISQRVDAINANRSDGTTGNGGISSSDGSKAESAEASEGAVTYHLSYQSRVGPVEWLSPYTDSKIHELADKGCKNLVVVPVSFVSEHIETLEEIDMEYREVAEEAGVARWRRVPALNTDEAFMEDMANMVVEALALPTLTVSEAFTRNNCDRKESDGPLDRFLQGAYGAPVQAKGARGNDAEGNGSGSGADRRANAARALSTFSGAAFAADGIGREVAGLFTSTSDGIFF